MRVLKLGRHNVFLSQVHIEVEGQAASREAVRYTLVSPPWGGGAVKEENQAKKRRVAK